MNLADYLASKKMTQTQFASRLAPPVSQGLVSHWIQGTSAMTLDRALEIERLTDGAITVEDCAAMSKSRSAVESSHA